MDGLRSFDCRWPLRWSEDRLSPYWQEPQQLPTPAASSDSSCSPSSYSALEVDQDSEQNSESVSVSISFHPSANLLPIPTDVIIVSSDAVFFYVHSAQLLSKSCNEFSNLLLVHPSNYSLDTAEFMSEVLQFSEPAAVINILLHYVYNMSSEHYQPTMNTLSATVDAMETYGLSPKDNILPSTALFALILNLAPVQPITAYALAASHELDSLAVSVSCHLLSYPLQKLTPELAVKIGPIYLKRLFFLHLGRLEALRRILLPPPAPHPSTWTCNFVDQRRLTRAWLLASASIAWDAGPDLSGGAIEGALCPLLGNIHCPQCKQSLAEHVRSLVVQWSMVKRSI